jgi:hypothetical protein
MIQLKALSLQLPENTLVGVVLSAAHPKKNFKCVYNPMECLVNSLCLFKCNTTRTASQIMWHVDT